MADLMDLSNFITPSESTLIASCETTLDDLVKTHAISGKHIHCSFPINSEYEFKRLERKLIDKGVISIAFSNKKVAILKEDF